MKVVATLACRAKSTRLYAKPLQYIDVENEITILEYLVGFLKTCESLDEIVLAISEGVENKPFEFLAEKMGLRYVIGPEMDVQQRLITAAEEGGGDVIYRLTTDCPFVYMDTFGEVLRQHVENGGAVTVIEGLPEGTYYELIDLESLRRAHEEGEGRHREHCSLYMFENPDKFFLQRLRSGPSKLQRPDIRLTVDYPEDLVVVRELHKALRKGEGYIRIEDIIEYLDAHPKLNEVNSWIDAGDGRIWD